MSHATAIESALQSMNEDLEQIVYGRRQAVKEREILGILTLMACIRTRALESGWDGQCDTDLNEAQTLLRNMTI